MIGLSELLNLVLSPPPLGQDEFIQVWMRRPAANRQRLLWRLGQLLER
jgi:hypothetical protein